MCLLTARGLDFGLCSRYIVVMVELGDVRTVVVALVVDLLIEVLRYLRGKLGPKAPGA